jgi:hypothetical protein
MVSVHTENTDLISKMIKKDKISRVRIPLDLDTVLSMYVITVVTRGGHRQLFFRVRNRNSATYRKHFHNRNSATFKEMLLRNRNSAITIFLKSATSNPQLESFNSAIFGTFLVVESG